MLKLLIFAALLAVAYGEITSTGTCKTPTPKKLFKFKNFFTGTWFTVQKYGESPTTTCDSMLWTCMSNGTVEVQMYKYTGVNGNTTFGYGQAGTCISEGVLTDLTIPADRIGLVITGAKLTVIDTDYTNWATVYACFQSGTNMTEYLWLTSRGTVFQPADLTAALAAATAQGISTSQLVTVNQQC